MKINKIENNITEKEELASAVEAKTKEALRLLDPAYEARLKLLDEVSNSVANAGRTLCSVVGEADTKGNTDTKHLYDAGQELSNACRSLRTVLTGTERLIEKLVRELLGIVQAIAINESNLFEMNTKTECLRQALEDKGVVSIEDLKKAFDETIKPMLKKGFEELEQKK